MAKIARRGCVDYPLHPVTDAVMDKMLEGDFFIYESGPRPGGPIFGVPYYYDSRGKFYPAPTEDVEIIEVE